MLKCLFDGQLSCLAASPAVRFSADDEQLLALMRIKGLCINNLDPDERTRLRSFLVELHVNRGVSLTDIAKMVGNKTSGYISWLCRQLGVEARPFEEARLRGIKEKRRKHERRPFDGTDEDRAYMLGLRHGDLSVSRPWNGVVRVSTSTTHPAMANLFRSLFEPYGHVYQHPRYRIETDSYEWNLIVIVDQSFEFLLENPKLIRERLLDDESAMLSYLAGIVDAEGSVGIYGNGKGTSIQVLVYNTNLELLGFVKTALGRLGLAPLGPYLDKRKGTTTSKYRITRRKDYWKVAIARFDQSQSLLRRLPIKHAEKVRRRDVALAIQFGAPWVEVGPRVQDLRDSFRTERDSFVIEAMESFSNRHRNGGSANLTETRWKATTATK
jgi:hypothetical protein